jgi:hypothetical protein
MISDAQNNLPAEAENTFRSQGFVWILNGLVMNDNNKKQLKKTGRRLKKTRRPSAIRFPLTSRNTLSCPF